MKPEEFDKELLATSGSLEDVEWHDVFTAPISLHGVNFEEKNRLFYTYADGACR